MKSRISKIFKNPLVQGLIVGSVFSALHYFLSPSLLSTLNI
jgi:predicted permease